MSKETVDENCPVSRSSAPSRSEQSKNLTQRVFGSEVPKNTGKPKSKNWYPMIFVGGLGVSTTPDDLIDAFRSEGFSITVNPKIRKGNSFAYCPNVALATAEQVMKALAVGQIWVKDRFADIREYKNRSKDDIVIDPRDQKPVQKKTQNRKRPKTQRPPYIPRESYSELSARERDRLQELEMKEKIRMEDERFYQRPRYEDEYVHRQRYPPMQEPQWAMRSYDLPRHFGQMNLNPANFNQEQTFLAPSPIPVLAPSPVPGTFLGPPMMTQAPSPHMLMPMAPSPMLVQQPMITPSPIPILQHQQQNVQSTTPIPVLVNMKGNQIVSVDPIQNSEGLTEQLSQITPPGIGTN